jgi:hypothetical protein
MLKYFEVSDFMSQRNNMFIPIKNVGSFKKRAMRTIDLKYSKQSYSILKHHYIMLCLENASLLRRIEKLETTLNITKGNNRRRSFQFYSIKQLRSTYGDEKYGKKRRRSQES